MCKVCARAGPSTMHDMGARLLAERLQLLICFGMAKRSGLLIPVARLALVLAHALAELIHYADVEHGPWFAEPCGLLVPAPGVRVIFWHSLAVVIHAAEIAHGVGVSLLRRPLISAASLAIILCNSPTG